MYFKKYFRRKKNFNKNEPILILHISTLDFKIILNYFKNIYYKDKEKYFI